MRDRDEWYAFWSRDDEPEDWKEESGDEARHEKESFKMQWCFKGDERRIMDVVGHLLDGAFRCALGSFRATCAKRSRRMTREGRISVYRDVLDCLRAAEEIIRCVVEQEVPVWLDGGVSRPSERARAHGLEGVEAWRAWEEKAAAMSWPLKKKRDR